jgi:hypothetical protein
VLILETKFKQVAVGIIKEIFCKQNSIHGEEPISNDLEDSILGNLISLIDRIYFKNETIVMSFDEANMKDNKIEYTRNSLELKKDTSKPINFLLNLRNPIQKVQV